MRAPGRNEVREQFGPRKCPNCEGENPTEIYTKPQRTASRRSTRIRTEPTLNCVKTARKQALGARFRPPPPSCESRGIRVIAGVFGGQGGQAAKMDAKRPIGTYRPSPELPIDQYFLGFSEQAGANGSLRITSSHQFMRQILVRQSPHQSVPRF